MVDEDIFTFKRKIHRWLKYAEEEQQRYAMSEKSRSSKGSSSKSSRHGSKSNASRKSSRSSKAGDSKTRAMEEKAKLAELLAEESFLMKRQIAENEAERLKVQEMVAKAKARAKVYEESESGDGKLFPQTEEARPSKQTDIDHYFQRGSHQKLIHDEHLHSKKTDIAELLCNLVKQQTEMLERMYYSDFCECNHLQMKSILGNIEDISREDRKFLDILETGTKKDGAHFEVSLPFRNIGIQLPNKRYQAVKRIHHLKRFIKDPQFFEEIKDKWKSFYLNVMLRKQMSNQIMARYGIFHIMVSSIQANLQRLELFSTAVPIIEELH